MAELPSCVASPEMPDWAVWLLVAFFAVALLFVLPQFLVAVWCDAREFWRQVLDLNKPPGLTTAHLPIIGPPPLPPPAPPIERADG